MLMQDQVFHLKTSIHLCNTKPLGGGLSWHPTIERIMVQKSHLAGTQIATQHLVPRSLGNCFESGLQVMGRTCSISPLTCAFLTQQTSRRSTDFRVSDALKVAQWRSEGYRAPQCSRQGDDSPSDTSATPTW